MFVNIVHVIILTLRLVNSCKMTCSCKCGYGVANCSGMNLSTIPDIFSNTSHLILSNNRMSEMQNNSLIATNDSVVTILDLSQNSLSYLPPEAMISVPLLQEIDLSLNNFKEFPIVGLRVATNTLRKVFMRKNNLTILNGTELESFTGLSTFDVRGNCFRFIDDLYDGIPNIENLYVGEQLDQCPILAASNDDQQTLKKWEKLKVFEYSGAHNRVPVVHRNYFSSIPPSLVDIGLRFLHISELSFIRSNLKIIYMENIAGNTLLEDFETTCDTLLELYMINSVVKKNDKFSIASPCATQTVYIRNSTNIYEGYWKYLTSLKTLSIIGNGLDKLSDFAMPLYAGMKLHMLNLSTNSILTLAKDSLKFQTDLVVLDLRSNMIDTFDGSAFQNVQKLTHIDLSSNQIRALQSVLSLANLTYVSLAKNKIQVIPTHFFSNCSQLQLLDLSYNHISMLGSIAAIHSSQLAIVGDGNPWHCDSSFVASYTAITSKKRIGLICGNEYDLIFTPPWSFQILFKQMNVSDDILCLICRSPNSTQGLLGVEVMRLQTRNANVTSQNEYTEITTSRDDYASYGPTGSVDYIIVKATITVGGLVLIISLAITVFYLLKGIRKKRKRDKKDVSGHEAGYTNEVMQMGEQSEHPESSSVSDPAVPPNKKPDLGTSAFSRLNNSKYLTKFLGMRALETDHEYVEARHVSGIDESIDNEAHDGDAQKCENVDENPVQSAIASEESYSVDGYLSFSPPVPDVLDQTDEVLARNIRMSNSLYLVPVISARKEAATVEKEEHVYSN